MTVAPTFPLTPDLAAETGIHIGDGSLLIKRKGRHGAYRYDITGHAIENQLYLIGTVMPIVSSAYNFNRPGVYINRALTWVSLGYQSKAVALFKHETLGLPNGRKTNISIPVAIRNDARLMRHLARELLATDGVLGFYNASKNGPHKYPRIQIRLSTARVIEELASFLRNELGISVSCRTSLAIHDGWANSRQYILQISRSEDIEIWRREIGFSNPSHISRMMVFESLGECIPRTSIVNRLSFLRGRSSRPATSDTITANDLVLIVDKMRKSFGFPRVTGEAVLQKMEETNKRLESALGRKLPRLVDS